MKQYEDQEGFCQGTAPKCLAILFPYDKSFDGGGNLDGLEDFPIYVLMLYCMYRMIRPYTYRHSSGMHSKLVYIRTQS